MGLFKIEHPQNRPLGISKPANWLGNRLVPVCPEARYHQAVDNPRRISRSGCRYGIFAMRIRATPPTRRGLSAARETKYAPAWWGGRSRPNVEMHREKRARREQQHDGHQVGHLSCRAAGLQLDNEHCGTLPGQGGLILRWQIGSMLSAVQDLELLSVRRARSVRHVRTITNERGRQLRRPYSL